jgi:hypothetical protein
MDGRETKIEALGIQLTQERAGKFVPSFGPIPTALYDQIIEDSERDETDKKRNNNEEIVFVRFELTEAEFETTHKAYQIWEKYAKNQQLPRVDPFLNVMEFFSGVTEGLNQCGDKVKMNRPTRREVDEIAAKLNPPQQPLEYIRTTRKKNEDLHVTNSMYPWGWRPLIQQPGH